MKTIVFDTGPVISLTVNNLLWILEPLKKMSGASFCITDSVKRELVDTPLNKTKRFKFEALQVLDCIESGIIEVVDNEDIKIQTMNILEIANSCFRAFGHNISLLHEAEVSSFALYLQKNADALVMDERTARLLIENPKRLFHLLRHNLHTNIEQDKKSIREFEKITQSVKVIRSVELAILAFEKGLLDKYIADIPDSRKTLLESVLWSIKLSGCAVSRKELEQIIRIEK